MLAASPLRSTRDESCQGEMESFDSMGASNDEFADLSDASLLESINFDDLFDGINVDGDALPDLEMDGGDMFAEFSGTTGGEESSVDNCCSKGGDSDYNQRHDDVTVSAEKKEVDGKSDSGSGSGHTSGSNWGRSRGEEIVSKREVVNPSPKDGGKGRKSKSQSKSNPQGKIRKVKVDWTPELHRRFVQAVEQLGVEKAVPSKILEIMGIDCLTRHNIASHLQKYRSHRKHLLAREAEAANWSQRRQMYGGGKGAPTMGFPPITPMHHFRPLHVWGHPSSMPMWPKHPPHSLSPSPLPPLPLLPSWVPPAPSPLPSPDPSFWYAQHHRAPNALTPGTPCFPQPLATTRFGSLPVPSIPPHAIYKADPSIGVPASPKPLLDFHPSKESIDATIGDVLSKPWLPLPLGLKAPVLGSVLGELQRQGIPNIPPS